MNTNPARDSEFVTSPARGDGFAVSEGSMIGPYRLCGELGRGGMGVVYRAEDPALRRQVALKVMHPHLAADALATARFLQEARAAAALFHDHVVPVYHVGEQDGVPYLVMPLLKGEPLSGRVKREGRLPVGEAVGIARAIAAGLAAAHAAGLIHRDIKPSNVWLEEPPPEAPGPARAKVLDFGLVRSVDSSEPLTSTGAVLGTPSYMPPEQARGEVADARADVYALGATLFHMLTGRPPYTGRDTYAVLSAIATTDPPAPRELDPSVPAAVSDLVMRFMARDPDRRPPNAGAAFAALRQLARRPPTAAGASAPARQLETGPVTKTIPQAPPRHRPRRRLWIAAGLVSLFAAGVAVWAATRPDERSIAKGGEPATPNPAPPPADPPRKAAADGPAMGGAPKAPVPTVEPKVPVPTPGVTLRGHMGPTAELALTSLRPAYAREFGVQFEPAASGPTLSPAELENAPYDFQGKAGPVRDRLAAIPLALCPIALIYNVPGLKEPLSFDGRLLGDIYLGKITSWSDPAVRRLNPGANLPDLKIVPVRRHPMLGITVAWVQYLEENNDDWVKTAGRYPEVKWPTQIQTVKSTPEAVLFVNDKPGAIGYAELGPAVESKLGIGRAKNMAGTFVPPTPEGATEAAGKSSKIPDDLVIRAPAAMGSGSYPIVLTCWASVPRNLPADRVRPTVAFLRWCANDGQRHLPDAHFGRLPELFVRRANAVLAAALPGP